MNTIINDVVPLYAAAGGCSVSVVGSVTATPPHPWEGSQVGSQFFIIIIIIIIIVIVIVITITIITNITIITESRSPHWPTSGFVWLLPFIRRRRRRRRRATE
ncbi:hypothetical protein I7I51_03119 [Histoplasma capsulatum]|uniref:Uncharacterized protein n=1 Tax=Ajellomyces capsulatus TaxID=5037 RepID=A0A8A1MS72_AJECA|nr:hypothetical protein I7I51_03119 [Histoplasma capsulatum]